MARNSFSRLVKTAQVGYRVNSHYELALLLNAVSPSNFSRSLLARVESGSPLTQVQVKAANKTIHSKGGDRV